MIIQDVQWAEIQDIPKFFDLGGASFADHKKKGIWFAKDVGGLFGAVSKTLFLSKNKARICSIWVHPEYRRQGLATMMINHQINHAKKSGCKMISAISKERIFEKFGFVPIVQYREGSSLWIMQI